MYALMTFAHADDRRVPLPHYYGGPGNEKDFDPVMQGIGSATGAGLSWILARAQHEFAADLANGLRSFAVFGFSRGAAEAVETTHVFEDAAKSANTSFHMRFLGLFDTVAAVGPTGDGHGALRLQPARDAGAPDRIYHAVSQDETRKKFALVDVGVLGIDHVIKDAFPGAHSDVGGSYANKGLSNIALHRMVEEARRAGIPMPTLEETIARHPNQADSLLPFLHQDANQPRHFIDPIYSGAAVRDLPRDAKRAESMQVQLRRNTQRVHDPSGDFDRRAEHPYREVTIGDIRVDPSGRFVFTDADPEPGARAMQRRNTHHDGHDDDGGIPLSAQVVDGALMVDNPGTARSDNRRR